IMEEVVEHISEDDGVAPMQKIRCSFEGCEKSFKRKSAMRKHYRQHTNVYPFRCLECEKGFHGRVLLREHTVKEHGTSGIGKCKQCGQMLKNRRETRKHMLEHAG